MTNRIDKIIDNLPEDIAKKINKNAITWFECKRSTSMPYCKCGHNKAVHKCEFPLRGLKEGQNCDRLLCKSCSTEIDGKHYCRPHSRML